MSAAIAITATVAGDRRTVQQMHVTLEEEGAMKGFVKRSRSIAVRAAMVGGLALGALVATTSAAQAQAQLNFGGSALLKDVVGNPSQLFVSFLDGAIMANETISGPFMTTISAGTTGDIENLIVADAPGVVGMPISNFVEIGGFTFTLTGAPAAVNFMPQPSIWFGPMALYQNGTNTSGSFGVTGIVTGGIYGATGVGYNGIFTTQFINKKPFDVFNAINSGGTVDATFSATFEVVPEPSTYLMLATGLGALALVGLRRRSQQS